MSTMGERIKLVREKKGLKQEKLGELIGAHAVTISRWERGKNQPNSDALKQIAHVLETSVAYLTGETDDPKRYTTILGDGPEIDGNKRSLSPAAFISRFPPKEGTLLGSATLPESNVRFTDVTWVPVVDGAITICCGTGTAYAEDVEWNVVGKYPVPTADLMGFSWVLKDGGFRIITVEGDSMAPRIEDGDQVLFADAELLNGDIGLVRYRGRYMIRGVFFEGGGIRLQATNKDYDPIIVPQENEDFCILGKVLLKIAIEKLNGLW